MSNSPILLGLGRFTLPVPNLLWSYLLKQDEQKLSKSLGFMTRDHHVLRDFVVRALPDYGSPLSPPLISQETGLDLERVVSILEELERRLTFLVRNPSGEVSWAYPVTTDQTPHQIVFSTGQRINAA